MSKREAQLVTESAAAKQRLVHSLSAYVEVEKDNKADNVVWRGTPIPDNHHGQSHIFMNR